MIKLIECRSLLSINDLLATKSPPVEVKQKPEQPNYVKHKKHRKRHGKRADSFNQELNRVHQRVKGFDINKSIAWKTLTNTFGDKLTHEELTSIAELIANTTKIKLDRDAKRRKIVLIKWFEEHWDTVRCYLPIITLE